MPACQPVDRQIRIRSFLANAALKDNNIKLSPAKVADRKCSRSKIENTAPVNL